MSDFSIQPAGHGPLIPVRTVPSLSHPTPNGVHAARFDAGAAVPGGDRVELSDHARLLAIMRDMPEVREDRVNRVRGAIDRGVYETDQRINATIERLIAEEDLMGC